MNFPLVECWWTIDRDTREGFALEHLNANMLYSPFGVSSSNGMLSVPLLLLRTKFFFILLFFFLKYWHFHYVNYYHHHVIIVGAGVVWFPVDWWAIWIDTHHYFHVCLVDCHPLNWRIKLKVTNVIQVHNYWFGQQDLFLFLFLFLVTASLCFSTFWKIVVIYREKVWGWYLILFIRHASLTIHVWLWVWHLK